MRGGVAGAYGGPDGREWNVPRGGEFTDFGERDLEVLMNVVGERFQRRDVDDMGVRREGGAGEADQTVEAKQECGEGLAGACGSGNENVAAGADDGPAEVLRLGDGGEAALEPFRGEGVELAEVHGAGSMVSRGEMVLGGMGLGWNWVRFVIPAGLANKRRIH